VNVCLFAGRLAQDPELNYLDGGQAVARFALAIQRVYKQEKITEFLDFQAWGKTAEFFTQHFHKGDPCIVHSSARVDKWKSKEGENRRKVVFNVDRVNFAPSKPNGGEQNVDAASVTNSQEELTDF
jgi:single-strand DNA-binding protein